MNENTSIIFTFPGYEHLAKSSGDLIVSAFPDGESLVTVETDVKNKKVTVICGLDNPNEKILPLLFFADLVRDLGATQIDLIAPYLGYMRQDKRFLSGQAITSKTFAKLISSHFDSITTIDPHLHRYKSLDEIYTIPTTVLHAAPLISAWIQEQVQNPVLVGPDEESRQWVQEVSQGANAPFIILQKTRHPDGSVEISAPDLKNYPDHTPVLVDDIISTGQTMAKTVEHLMALGAKAPVCIGIHAIFAGNALEMLQAAGAAKIVTTNTISHETNGIDVSELLSTTQKS